MFTQHSATYQPPCSAVPLQHSPTSLWLTQFDFLDFSNIYSHCRELAQLALIFTERDILRWTRRQQEEKETFYSPCSKSTLEDDKANVRIKSDHQVPGKQWAISRGRRSTTDGQLVHDLLDLHNEACRKDRYDRIPDMSLWRQSAMPEHSTKSQNWAYTWRMSGTEGKWQNTQFASQAVGKAGAKGSLSQGRLRVVLLQRWLSPKRCANYGGIWCANCGKKSDNDGFGCVAVMQHTEDASESVVFMADMPTVVIASHYTQRAHIGRQRPRV